MYMCICIYIYIHIWLTLLLILLLLLIIITILLLIIIVIIMINNNNNNTKIMEPVLYGRFPKCHSVFWGRDPGTLKSDIVSKNIHNYFVRIWDSQIENSKIEIMETDRKSFLLHRLASHAEHEERQDAANLNIYTCIYIYIYIYTPIVYTIIMHTYIYIYIYTTLYCTTLHYAILYSTLLYYAQSPY